ncbi:MAG: lysophospholipid acyltransferase family protein [Patescibacteria group bacterium]
MSIGSQRNDNIEKFQIILQSLIQFATLLFFKIFFTLKIEGGEEVLKELIEARKKDKGLLFAPNHISEWDAIIVRCALPIKAFAFPLYYVAMTKDHYQYEKFGWRRYFYGGNLFKVLGAYPAYLGMRDYHASLVNHIELLEYGKSVCIFPEGKISVDTSKPGEAKGGIGFLAEYTQTDIVPVTLKGFERLSWVKGIFGKKPVVTVVYHQVLRISNILETAKKQGVAEGIETNKFVSNFIMDIVRKA